MLFLFSRTNWICLGANDCQGSDVGCRPACDSPHVGYSTCCRGTEWSEDGISGCCFPSSQGLVQLLVILTLCHLSLFENKVGLNGMSFMYVLGVVATTDAVEACTGVNVAVMVGGFPRKEGMERKDVMSKNVSIYKSQASALEKHAAPNCKVRQKYIDLC